MPLTPEEEKRRRKAGDKDALGYFGAKGGNENSAFGVKTTTEAPGVSAPKEKRSATDYRGTTYKDRPDAEKRSNLSKEEYQSRRQSQRDSANTKDFAKTKANDFAVGNLANFNLRGYGAGGSMNKGNAAEEPGKGAARFSRHDARNLLQHGRHTAEDLKDYATGLNSDDDRTNGFAGGKAITFLNKKIEQNKNRTQYKATADIAPHEGKPRGTPRGLDPDLAKAAFKGKDFGSKDLKRYEDLYKSKYGTKPPKGTYEQGPNTPQPKGQPQGQPQVTNDQNSSNNNQTKTGASTDNTVEGNKYSNLLNNSMNNNSGTITNDFSDNRISFQSGSNVYNFNNQGKGRGTPMSNMTMAQVAKGEDMADNMKYTTMASALNSNLQKRADAGFNPAATAIAGNKSDVANKTNKLNDYIFSSPQNMFDQSDIELSKLLGDQYKQDGMIIPNFVIDKDKDKD